MKSESTPTLPMRRRPLMLKRTARLKPSAKEACPAKARPVVHDQFLIHVIEKRDVLVTIL